MRVRLEGGEFQVALDGDLAGALEALARIEAGQKVLAQRLAAIEASLVRLTGAGSGRGPYAPVMVDDPGDDMITESEVIRLTGLSKSSIWRKQLDGSFPHRRKLSDRRVGWLRSEVMSWRDQRNVA